MNDNLKRGRVTIPTDLDVVPQTLEIMKRWGADAIRDCDGTDFPAELKRIFGISDSILRAMVTVASAKKAAPVAVAAEESATAEEEAAE